MRTPTHLIALLSLVVVFACQQMPTQQDATADLDELASLMTGSFSSAAQAETDTNYYDITLHMYPIWETKNPAVRWLYVEQAVSSMQQKPYRQRVYKVEIVNESIWKSSVFTLPDPETCIGKWKKPAFFDALTEADLTLRTGCAVFLKQMGDKHFKGSTDPKACGSTLRGASYATSVVEVMEDRIESWDQGFDANDEQVWGATEGGYVFLRN